MSIEDKDETVGYLWRKYRIEEGKLVPIDQAKKYMFKSVSELYSISFFPSLLNPTDYAL
jgi:hypothetical protein